MHISESKSKDIVDKNSISDVVKEKLIVETSNEKEQNFHQHPLHHGLMLYQVMRKIIHRQQTTTFLEKVQNL